MYMIVHTKRKKCNVYVSHNLGLYAFCSVMCTIHCVIIILYCFVFKIVKVKYEL